MNPAIEDVKSFVNEIVYAIGANAVVNRMKDFGWIEINPLDVGADVAAYLEDEVDSDELDAMTEIIYAEFYNIAAENNYVPR